MFGLVEGVEFILTSVGTRNLKENSDVPQILTQIFFQWGGGANPEALYNLFFFLF
jgi:hypothetical protein